MTPLDRRALLLGSILATTGVGPLLAQDFGVPVDVNVGVGNAPDLITGVVAGDLDLDRFGDIVATESGTPGQFGYTLGTATGYASPVVVSVVQSGPVLHPTLGDFDRDGLLDVAMSGTVIASGELAIYVSRGSLGSGFSLGTPFGPWALGPGTEVTDVAATDFNRDGFLDVLATVKAPTGNRLDILYGTMPPSPSVPIAFAPVTSTSTGVGADAIDVCVDFNGDGRKDAVICGSSASASAVGIFPGSSSALPGPPIVLPLPAGFMPIDVHWSDCDQDGSYDVVVAGAGSSPRIMVIRNLGVAPWFDASSLGSPKMLGRRALSLLRLDLDFDGVEDLAVLEADTAGQPPLTTRVEAFSLVGCQLESTGALEGVGVYSTAVDSAASEMLAVADQDFDGRVDLMVASHDAPNGRVRLFRNLGATTLTVSPTTPFPGTATPFTVRINAPTGLAQRRFLILYSFAGTLPGLSLAGNLTLPLNGPLLPFSVSGTLDAAGDFLSTTQPIVTPAIPTFFSAHLYGAAIVEGAVAGTIGFVTDPAFITLP